MVIPQYHKASARAFLMAELVVGMAILVIALLPLAYSMNSENRLFRATYQRAVAMEIVDGEMEILAAGGWQAVPEGTQSYTISARAAANLPPGKFQLTRTGKHLRLEWTANAKKGIGTVMREVTVE